ncbi:Pycsar system effector family protein [Actinomadura formosensis]|uniref:Pycsar system effector family protein n=1 Tax=Actinomadura formosensis TaxID=60706 RepID=UPI000834B365|nr:Pycsar system effector family protein [Actinomadura formosensis]
MTAPLPPVDAELAAVRGEQARLDAKCGTLTAVVGAVMAILTSQIGRAPLPVRVVLALAGVALAASAVVLLAGVLRPRLGGSGFVRYAAMTSAEIGEAFDRWAPHHPINDLRFLSGLVLVKQRRLRWAIDLLITGLVLIGIALGAAVIT